MTTLTNTASISIVSPDVKFTSYNLQRGKSLKNKCIHTTKENRDEFLNVWHLHLYVSFLSIFSFLAKSPCDPNPCYYSGVCRPGSTACNDYVCDCPGCFTGLRCETVISQQPCASNPCRNGGACITGADGCSYTCQCPTCYVGRNCETLINDPCIGSPCANGGSCQPAGTNCFSHECVCTDCWAGPACTIRKFHSKI